MLNCCRRADAAERQLQRREAEAAHLAQKQTDTEAALSALQEQHTQASAAAAAQQLVLQVTFASACDENHIAIWGRLS